MNALTRTLAAGLAVLMLGTSAMTVPAEARGGSISFSMSAANQQQDRAVRTGLAIYSIYNSVKGGGGIKQRGEGNSAGVAQNGQGNLGLVHQEGRGHEGTIRQNGNGNAHGLFQFGRNTTGNVVQNGNGRTGATFQFGW